MKKKFKIMDYQISDEIVVYVNVIDKRVSMHAVYGVNELKWVDKEKGLAYLSSASQPVQQEIDKQVLDDATKVVENFENPKVRDEKVSDNEELLFRDGDGVEYEKAHARGLYEGRVARGLYQMQEALQDSMLGLKEAMSAVLRVMTWQSKRWTASRMLTWARTGFLR